jgi:hypothetical protein
VDRPVRAVGRPAEYPVRDEGSFRDTYLADPRKMRAFADEPPEWSPWA